MNFKEVLLSHYGVRAQHIDPTPGGWSADAYRVLAEDGAYFLKVYDADRPTIQPWIERMARYIPAVAFLQAQPDIGPCMVPMLRTMDGGFRVETAHRIFMLFPLVEGVVPGETPLTNAQTCELASILARLHGYAAEQLPASCRNIEEELSLPFCENLRAILERTAELPARLQLTLTSSRQLLQDTAEITLALRDAVRQSCTSLVLCHTDAHNWNVIQSDRLILLDWEGLCLAPPEADLYAFWEREEFSVFWEAYAAVRTGFQMNERLAFFYAFRRKTEDIWEFIAQILMDGLDDDAQQRAYGHLACELERLRALWARFAAQGMGEERA